MREEIIPKFNEEFDKACGQFDSRDSRTDIMEEVDKQVAERGLEVLLFHDGSYDDYRFKVVPKGENVVLSLSPAHVLALRKYLSLDMGKIGVTDNPALYLLLKDALDKLGGYRGYDAVDNAAMTAHCKADPELSQKLVESVEYPDDE